MKEIEITIEKMSRVAKTFEVPDSVYEEIMTTNRLPDDLFNDMKYTLDDVGADDIGYDYAVWSETEQKQLVEWG